MLWNTQHTRFSLVSCHVQVILIDLWTVMFHCAGCLLLSVGSKSDNKVRKVPEVLQQEQKSCWFILCARTQTLLRAVVFSHSGIHWNLIIYEGYVIAWEQVGAEEWALCDIWSRCGASLFKLRNKRPPMFYISNVVRRGGAGQGRSADLALTQWNLDLLPLSACCQSADQLLHLPHTALAPTFHSGVERTGTFLVFRISSSPHSLLTGRIRPNCIVYDRCRSRLGADSRLTAHRRFMVSFHLTRWFVVMTRFWRKPSKAEVCVWVCVSDT